MAHKTEKIGEIIVDTGKIIVFDPFYARDLSYRLPRRLYEDKQTGEKYEYGVHFQKFTDKVIEEKCVSDLINEGRLVFVFSEEDFSMGSMTENIAEKGFWQAKFENGNIGKAVALAVDDGVYDVIAEYDEDEILKKISILI
jgi:hypothetical protein